MSRLYDFTAERWLVVGLLAIVLLVPVLARLRSLWGVLAGACLLLVAGHFLLPPPVKVVGRPAPDDYGPYLLIASAALLAVSFVWLLLSRRWSRWFALACFAGVCLGVGGSFVGPIQAAGKEVRRAFASVEFVHPGWLWLLGIVPVLIRLSYRSLAGLGPVRRWVALGMRCALVTLLVLAIAEPRLRKPSENVTVMFVVDRSQSIPTEDDPGAGRPGTANVDLRWQRVQTFINDSVAKRGPDHRLDQAGAILFGKRPRLVMPPASVDRMVVSDDLAGPIDGSYTDIAGAIKLAMASFPEGTSKRIVLLSDGNENLGSAEEQARLARNNGIQIDTVPLASGYRNENEVLVQGVEVPSQVARGTRLPIRVLIRNANPSRIVYGTLELLRNRDGDERPIPAIDSPDVVDNERSPAVVKLRPGLNSFSFRDKAETEGRDEEFSFSYRAVFVPIETRDERNRNPIAGLPGDRQQNNRGLAHTIARGSRKVLLLQDLSDDRFKSGHEYLIAQLRQAKFQVSPISPERLPQNKGELAVFLSNYDLVVIANVPSERLSGVQQETIRSNTYDQGCGLIFVGGPESYGSGGYQNTPIEAALPVNCEIEAIKAAAKGGLVMILHACEMAEGNFWQKKIAKLAIEKLSPVDMVGVLYFDGTTRWHIPFQSVGFDKSRLFAAIDKMQPGDMPDFDPFLVAAEKTLSDAEYALATKHCIVISDGDPQYAGPGKAAVARMQAGGITCSTVGVASHGFNEDSRMTAIANDAAPGGKFYKVADPAQLPAIYTKEARRVSQSFVHDKRFNPKLVLKSGPTDKLDAPLPDLMGFVRTTMKNSPLAEMLIEGPPTFDQRFPILAVWQYGLGRAVAFTSDARSIPSKTEGWDREWAGSDTYLKFWENVVNYAIRGLETDKLQLTTEFRDGKVRIVVEARDENGKPITDLKLDAGLTAPGGDAGKPTTIALQQKSGGVYVAEVKAEDAGTWLVNVRARQLVSAYEDGRPRYRGRTRIVAAAIEDRNGRLVMEDGTEVIKKADGTLAYADDGKPVEVIDKVEKVVDSRRSGVSLSYSPEYADLESNSALMESLARTTGGRVYAEDAETLARVAKSGEVFRPAPETVRSLQPFWYWLIFVAALVLVLDVAVRRISLTSGEALTGLSAWWGELRTRQKVFVEGEENTLSRLKSRKDRVGETMEQTRASRRFEVSEAPISGPSTADDLVSTSGSAGTFVPPAPPTTRAQPTEPETEDYFSKLKKAKKRAPTDRPEG